MFLFARNTKNLHIVYNWLPYSKPIERDALCPGRLRRRFSDVQKTKAILAHVQDGVPVSQVCEDLGIHPNQYYEWQKQAFPVCLTFFPETLFGMVES